MKPTTQVVFAHIKEQYLRSSAFIGV